MRALRIVDSTLHTVRNKFSANLLQLNDEIKLGEFCNVQVDLLKESLIYHR